MAEIIPPTAPAAVPTATPISVVAPTERISVPAASALGLETPPGAEADSIASGKPIVPVKPPESVVPSVVPPVVPAPVVPPVKPPEPVVPPVVPAPAKPESKVKVGDKEYTVAELEKALAEKKEAPAAPAAPAPVVPPTKEEIATKESEWKVNFLKSEGLNFASTPEELDTILAGGEEGTKLFTAKMNEAVASAVLHARKSLYADFGPKFASLEQALVPLSTQQVEMEKVAVESAFIAAHPDFVPHISTAREVAAALVTQFPEQAAKLTREQFAAEVARQTDNVLTAEFKRFNPNSTTTWRDAAKAAAAIQPPAPVVPAPVVPPAPAVPVVPPILPPTANVPSAQATAGAASTHKVIAQSLQD